MKKLYRADDDPPYVDAGSWWTPNKEVAKAYTEEGVGHGGTSVFVGKFNNSRVLDLTGGQYPDQWTNEYGIGLLAEKFDEEWLENVEDAYLHEVLDREENQKVLAKRYDWVVIYDSYPEGAETWLRLTNLSEKEDDSIKKA